MLRPLGSTYSSMHCPKSIAVFIFRNHVLKLNMCLIHSDLMVKHVHKVCLDRRPGEGENECADRVTPQRNARTDRFSQRIEKDSLRSENPRRYLQSIYDIYGRILSSSMRLTYKTRLHRIFRSRSGGMEPTPLNRLSPLPGLSVGEPSNLVHQTDSTSKRLMKTAVATNINRLARYRPGHMCRPPPANV